MVLGLHFMVYLSNLAKEGGYSLIRWLKTKASGTDTKSIEAGDFDKDSDIMRCEEVVTGALRQLERFKSLVLFSLDLEVHDNLYALRQYCFGIRDSSLKMVIGTATADPKQISQCQTFLKDMLNFLTAEIQRIDDANINESGFSEDEEKAAALRLNLFGELYDTISLQVHVWDPEGIKQMETLLQRVTGIISRAQLKNETSFLSKLTQDVRKLSGGKVSPIPVYSSSSTLPMYLREDALTSTSEMDLLSSAVSPVPSASVLPSKPKAAEVLFEVLDRVVRTVKSGGHINSGVLLPIEKIEKLSLSYNEVSHFMEQLCGIWFQTENQSENQESFIVVLQLLKYVFEEVSLEFRNSIFDQLTEFYQAQAEQGNTKFPIPRLNSCYGELGISFPQVMNKFGDHQTVQSNTAAFEKARDELMFLLLIDPLMLNDVLISCLENRAVVPSVTKALHCFPSLFTLVLTHTSGTKLPIIVPMIDTFFAHNADRFENKAFQEDFVYVIATFCKRRRAVVKDCKELFGEVIEEPLINAHDLVFNFILKQFFKKDIAVAQQIVVAQLLRRMLSKIGNKDVTFNWTDNIAVQYENGEGVVSATTLLIFIYEMMIANERKQQDIADVCRLVLVALASKLREDSFSFSEETTKLILEKVSHDAWWVRYALLSWFAQPLNSPRKQIPSGLYQALPDTVKEEYNEIVVDFESAPVACFLMSLFELGSFDVKLAIDLLNRGLGVKFMDVKLVEQIALALVDSCGKPFRGMRIAQLEPLFVRIIELLDPTMKVISNGEVLNMAGYSAFRNTTGIFLVSKAAKIASAMALHWNPDAEGSLPSSSLDKPQDPAKIAQELLLAFCELSKAHIDQELEGIKNQKDPNSSSTELSALYKTEGSLLIALSFILVEAVQLSVVFAENTPPQLRVLILTLSTHLHDIKMVEDRFFDDIVLEKAPEPVYVYIEGNRSQEEQPSSSRNSTEPRRSPPPQQKTFSNNRFNQCSTSASTHGGGGGGYFVDSHSMHPQQRDEYRKNPSNFSSRRYSNNMISNYGGGGRRGSTSGYDSRQNDYDDEQQCRHGNDRDTYNDSRPNSRPNHRQNPDNRQEWYGHDYRQDGYGRPRSDNDHRDRREGYDSGRGNRGGTSYNQDQRPYSNGNRSNYNSGGYPKQGTQEFYECVTKQIPNQQIRQQANQNYNSNFPQNQNNYDQRGGYRQNYRQSNQRLNGGSGYKNGSQNYRSRAD